MANLVTTPLQEAPEEKTYVLTVAYFNENDAAVTPTEARWTLTNDIGTVINNRLEVPITGLSTTNKILLVNDDLAIGDNGVDRHLLVEFTYNSSLGNGLKGASEVHFRIRNFTKVT